MRIIQDTEINNEKQRTICTNTLHSSWNPVLYPEEKEMSEFYVKRKNQEIAEMEKLC